MLHPSYTDLMEVVNSDVEPGEQPVVQSRYSIVLATAKRARQIIGGQDPLVRTRGKGIKPLSVAVDEMGDSKLKILTEEEAVAMALALEEEERLAAERRAAKKAAAEAKKAAEEAGEENAEETDTEETAEESEEDAEVIEEAAEEADAEVIEE